MRRMNWRCLAGLVGIVVVLSAVGLAVPYSGVYNVAATYPDRGLMKWAMSTTMDRSVVRHARGIKVPPLDDPAMVRLGFQHFREMCVACHGAPGVEISEMGQGLSPQAPSLVETAGEWKPEELFWLTKNGVRMTGMPAWGKTHTDEQIWAVVAFTQGLPKMTAEEWEKMDKAVPALEEE